MENRMKTKVVVIGNGMVGYKFCEKLVSKAGKDQFEIIVFAEETRVAYDRVHLSSYFDGKTVDDLTLAKYDWYLDNNIKVYLGDPVLSVNTQEKKVVSHHQVVVAYDYLVFATGSAAFVPPINGVDKNGVFVYRTIEDLDLMKAWSGKAKKGAVIGGGLLGLEAAKAMLDLGIKDTYVIEFASRLMPRQLDDNGSQILKNKIEALGIKVLLNCNTKLIRGEQDIDGMVFQDDTSIDVDMLVISAGIKPRDELAKNSGIEIGPRGGILVNDHLQTTDPHVFAIGECALHQSMIYGLVAPGYEMADVVATILTGGDKKFTGFDLSTKLKLIGVDVASFGNPFVSEPDCKTLQYTDNLKGIYKRINISTDGKTLLGGILVGEASSYNMLLQTVKNRTILPPDPEDLLIEPKERGESTGSGVMSLPDEALICSCESVSKAFICSSVTEQNCHTFDAVKQCTKAGTGCGGCVPMVKDLINETLKSQGIYVKKSLCEHFKHGRQELYDLIKIHQVKNYNDVLDQFGEGDGCEVCKPAVASILASLWNEPILKQPAIQDSNDRFLANIQRGGTYSVVPRIPGGEITPEKLIVIGQVAQKYGLYTKITGGQRIDLFGAHVGDLPFIWEELIKAGFESGHAYGKALRTVKSCVGTTWCRFGVQDAVSFAIKIEERYRGLRAPHKLKSAVSGCIRECAEAQSKDFGIIATEKGYNLYLCGNGGSKPQHAFLFATDLDEDTLIKYLDRFLIFYIKTADPLTRTATWFNKLEGGIPYLKSVIIDDSLGICEMLETEMQFLVDTYACEWKEAVENPEIRKRFTHFVNSPEKDPTVKFDTLREQKKAIDWDVVVEKAN